MIRLAGLRPEIDIKLEFTGLRPGEKLFEELFHGAEAPAPTGFSGLLMARPRAADLRLVTAAIDELERAIAAGDIAEAARILARIVPEFRRETARPAPGLAVSVSAQ
jgi:O-antigen biosynthesis protein WbqV